MVLTAAHNCYDRPSKKESKDMEFIPGNDGSIGRAIDVKKIYYPR